MEVQAKIKYIKVSPKKIRFITNDVAKLAPSEALDRLSLSPKRTAYVLRKVIKSAVDNATVNFKVKEDNLKFKSIRVDEGPFLKRFRAGGRGIAKPYKRRSSHILVVLESKTADSAVDKKRKGLKIHKRDKRKIIKSGVKIEKTLDYGGDKRKRELRNMRESGENKTKTTKRDTRDIQRKVVSGIRSK